MPVLRLASLTLVSTLLLSAPALADDKPASAPSPVPAPPAFRVGALVGGGAPSLISGELLLQVHSHFALALDYGTAPTIHLPLAAGVSLKHTTFSAAARVRPFGGDFFLGAGFGSQRFAASFTDPFGGPNVDARTSTIFVMPQLGFVHRFESGIALGSDIGVELPISTQMTDSPLPPPVYEATRFLEKAPIPIVNLVRIGYML